MGHYEADTEPIWLTINLFEDFVPKNVPVKFENNPEKKFGDLGGLWLSSVMRSHPQRYLATDNQRSS